MSGVWLCRGLEKRNVEKIEAGLITVGYIVTFPFAWQQAGIAKNKNVRLHKLNMLLHVVTWDSRGDLKG
jgi:hypothetical protein